MSKRISGITIEIDGDARKFTNELKDVEKAASNTQRELKDINRLLKMDPGNADLIAQKQRALADAIGETKEKLRLLKEASQQADQALANGTMSQEQYDALQREIVETEQDLRNLTDQYKEFASVSAQQIAAAGENVKQFGQSVEGAGRALMPVSAAVTALGAAGVKSFAEVDKTMALTNKTMSNTTEQAELLNKAMKDAASNSTFGMKEAAEATLNFARAGLSATEAASALAPAMNLAAGEGGNLDTVSAGLVGTINGFGDSFDKATHYADVFASACNNSALDIDSLSQAMGVAAPVFKTAGYEIEDATLYMGIMANNSIEASVAANSLKTGIARLVSPAKEGATMMDKLGISVTNADGSMKSSIQIQKELHDAFAKLSESEQIAAASAIFGKNQMAPWLALINTAPADVQELSNELHNCAGTTEEMAEAMMSGFGGSLEKLKSSIDVATESLGEALAPTISKIADKIQELVDWFNSLDSEQQTMIANIMLVVAALGPALIIIGKIIQAVGSIMTLAPQISSAISTVSGALSSLGPTMSSALSGITSGLSTAASSISSFMTADMGAMMAEGGAAAGATVAASIAAAVVAGLAGAEIGKKVGEEIFPDDAELYEHYSGITGTFEMLKDFAIAIWDFIVMGFEDLREKVSTNWQAFKEDMSAVWEGLKEKIREVIDAIKEKIEAFKQGVQEKFDAIKQKIEDIKQKFDNMRDKIRETMEKIKEHVRAAVDFLKSAFNFEWKLPHIKLPHFSIEGHFSLDPPSIPHISVDWYKKAYDDAMILSNPTIFGAMGGHLLGGGDGNGSETVVGTEKLMSMIGDVVAASGGGDTIIPVYIGTELIDEMVVKAGDRVAYRSGGR